MGFCRVQVAFLRDTGLPEDECVNTWHFITPGDVGDSVSAINALLDTFYSSCQTFISSGLTGGARTTYYDLAQPNPRPPVDVNSIVISTGGNPLPGECAVVLSFQGIVVPGIPQARRRGRLYLGPLTATSSSVATGGVRPSGALRDTIVAAAEALMDDTTTPGLIWCVFSPTTAGPEPWSSGELTNAFVTVVNGWVDDAFDTIRSRGLAASTRTVFPV